MKTDKIQQQYPILYRIVKNSVQRQKIPHAYLLVGQHHLLELAYWMSSVRIIESVKTTEVDHVLNQIKAHGNEDVLVLNGEHQSIKKDDVTEALRQLNLTSKQANGVKCLIVHHVDHGTPAALNAFLKGLEEPSSHDVHFILTTDNVNQVLPTIVSRCLVVNLASTVVEEIEVDEEVAHDVDAFINKMWDQLDVAIVELQLLNISDRNLLEQFFYHMYRRAQKLALEDARYLHLATVTNDMLSKINRSVNTALLMDEFGYRMKEENT